MKLGVQVGCVMWTNCLGFGDDPSSDTRVILLLKVIFHHRETGPKPILYRVIFQKFIASDMFC